VAFLGSGANIRGAFLVFFDTPANPLGLVDRVPNRRGAILIFSINDTKFNTSDLKKFQTGDPTLPVIYLDEASSRVFIHNRNGWKIDTDEVDAAGIEKLAARFNLPGLVRK